MYFALFWIITNILMLFMAAFVGFPSSTYYFVLRLLTSLSSLAGAFVAHEKPLHKSLFYVYLALAVLFNPIFIIRLSRSNWAWIDILAGMLLLNILYVIAKDENVTLKSPKIIISALAITALSFFCIINGHSVGIIFKGLCYLILALLMSFGTYGMSCLLFNRKPVAGKEPPPIILPLILAIVFGMIAVSAWKILLTTIGIL